MCVDNSFGGIVKFCCLGKVCELLFFTITTGPNPYDFEPTFTEKRLQQRVSTNDEIEIGSDDDLPSVFDSQLAHNECTVPYVPCA